MQKNFIYSIKREDISQYIPAFLSGAALVFTYPTSSFSILAWICIAPFLVSLYNMKGFTSFRAGMLFGIPYFFGTQYWIYHSLNHYGNLPFLVSMSVVFLLSLYESLYTAIFAIVFSRLVRKTTTPSTVLAAPLWCSLEYLRGYLLTGFPWSLLGYSQFELLPVIQIADITGVYGVSFLIILVNALLTDLFLLRRMKRMNPLFSTQKIALSTGISSLVIVLSLVYGFFSLKHFITGEGSSKDVRIGVIQGNIEQDMKWNPDYQSQVLLTYKRISEMAIQKVPDLIIWPETALPFYYGTDRLLTLELNDYVKKLSVPLLTGTMKIRKKNNSRGYTVSNSAILIEPDGSIPYSYDKIHLVPFGEYVPLKKILFFLDKLVVGIGDFSRGADYVKARMPWGEFATIICYEAIFPDLVRNFFINGGDIIVNITNDAWFGRTTGPYQHFAFSIFRAVENRRPLVRAANTGVSGVVDSAGRILSKTKIFEETFIVQDIPMHKRQSFYTRFGDVFSLLCIAFAVLMYLRSVIHR
jgi:apolipoprotein N-acyltransferase